MSNKDKWRIEQLENELKANDSSLSDREREYAKQKAETAKSRVEDLESGYYDDDFYGKPNK